MECDEGKTGSEIDNLSAHEIEGDKVWQFGALSRGRETHFKKFFSLQNLRSVIYMYVFPFCALFHVHGFGRPATPMSGKYGNNFTIFSILMLNNNFNILLKSGNNSKFSNIVFHTYIRSKSPASLHTGFRKQLFSLYNTPKKSILSKMFKHSFLPILLALLSAALNLAIFAVAVDPAPAGEPVLELYMHDILGGSNPTARPITGLLGNIYSGQIPFARPLGFNPPKSGVAIPNANGAIPTVNLNGIPLGTGLAGTAFTGHQNNVNNNNNNGNNMVTTQLGPDGLGLGFGTITVIDDILTSAPELGSQVLGKAQGVYLASSADGSTQMMAFTAMMEGGEYGDSLNFFGVYRIGSTMSRLSVTGGTGKFKNACGFAEMRSLIPAGQHVTDGAETLLRLTIQLTY